MDYFNNTRWHGCEIEKSETGLRSKRWQHEGIFYWLPVNTDKTKARENNCQNTMESYAKSNNKNEEVTMMPQITSMISNRNISLVKTEATTEGPNVQENNDPLYI